MKNLKRRKGFSLLEILLVFAIASAIIVASFFAYKSVQSKMIASNVSSKLNIIIENYRTLLSGTAIATNKAFIIDDKILSFITKDVAKKDGMTYSLGNETTISIGYSIGGIMNISAIIPESTCIDIAMNMLNKGYVVVPNSLNGSAKYYGRENSNTTTIINNAKIISGKVSDFTPSDIALSCKNDNDDYKSLANIMIMVSP